MVTVSLKDRAGRESSLDESDDEKHGNVYNGKTILDHSLPSRSLELIHFIVLAVPNSWFLCKQNAISNKIPPKIKMDLLKFKLEIAKARALATSPPTNKCILTDDEANSCSSSRKNMEVL
ncbi:hypothetical protein TNCV_2188371 [Trichonephila clavipes]|nr:hypothetical protein TNCV_2188371 [Trichonephila clavipes]